MMKVVYALGALLGLLAPAITPAVAQPLSTPEQVLEHIAAHPGDAALVSYTAAANGTPDPSDPVLRHNADAPMPLASTIKVVLLAAYSREVAAGRVSPDEAISLRRWERFYIPGTDGGAHAEALRELGLGIDRFGFAQQPGATVPLDAVVRAMIRWSDNAATDLLLERLGIGAVRATIAQAGLQGQEEPLSLAGVVLSWENHRDRRLTPARLRKLQRMSGTEYAALTLRLQESYGKPGWRRAELLWRQRGGPGSSYGLESQAAHTLFPRGTAADYARIMAGVVRGTFLSAEVSATMRRHLEWPMEIEGNLDVFEAFGTKGGSLAGILTEASYYIPRAGGFRGDRRVTVLFLRNLSLESYAALSESFAQQVFSAYLALDPAFVARVEGVLAGASDQ